MSKVAPFHTSSDEEDPKYHTYNDCPAGERVIKDGNAVPGVNGTLCDFCKTKDRTGHF
jgi:hypothetical protein